MSLTPPHSAVRSQPTSTLAQRWSDTLAGLAPRERRAVLVAIWVVVLALLWWVALAPAIKILRTAPARHANIDHQLAQMQRMAASVEHVRAMNSSPPPARNGAVAALERATSTLGHTARLSVQGDQAVLTLRGVAPEALAQWLSQVRVNARLFPIEASIQQQDNPTGWAGLITLAGPGLGPAN